MDVNVILASIFLAGALGTLYAYVIFPIVALLLARVRGRAPQRPVDPATPTAIVTVLVPAYNEEKSIGQKILNVLSADYPRHLLDVIVISDASTDGTDAIARGFQRSGVRLIAQATRQGKTAGLNRAVEVARGDIVVFTDANALYAPGTVRTLARYFGDPRVGLVTGYTRYTRTAGGEISEATNLYTSLERTIKRAESAFGCAVGADGAIFAMRRSLYRTLRDDDINDVVLPLGVVDQGFHCVFAEDAVCSEHPGANLESEFRRQSRITNRTLRALWRNAHLLNPLRFPAFSFFLFSHKVMRFMVPGFLIVAAASLLLLAAIAGTSTLLALLAGSAMAAALVVAGPRLFSTGRAIERLLRLCDVFVTINVAVLHGWWKFLSGQADAIWQHDRSAA